MIIVHRLLPGRTRRGPVAPQVAQYADTTVSVVVATLNEAARIRPCLDGLLGQGPQMIEAVIVDSNSTDGTQQLVAEYSARDARIRLITDPPLPEGWVGKVWALQNGLTAARGAWVLGIDADTRPHAALVDSVVRAARDDMLDVASFSPRFAGQTAGERWLQPAMLLSLVYRTGAAGASTSPDRVLANGQCFLARRELLLAHGGYASAKASFSDDVTLARHLARRGARVGFLDGSRIIDVQSYSSLREAWREWGRSFDLADSSNPSRQWLDVMLGWATQAMPLPLLLLSLAMIARGNTDVAWIALAGVNGAALLMRLLMLLALRGSYAKRGLPFWFSFTADIPAVVRLTLSTLRRPRAWRGRQYAPA